LLTSHTVETALQELAALVLAMAVVAPVRVTAAAHLQVPPLRVSFLKILTLTQQLWGSFAWGRRSRTPAQERAIGRDYFADVRLLAYCRHDGFAPVHASCASPSVPGRANSITPSVPPNPHSPSCLCLNGIGARTNADANLPDLESHQLINKTIQAVAVNNTSDWVKRRSPSQQQQGKMVVNSENKN